MARALVLGNGSLFVGMDEWGQVRDFYYPFVGSENHLAGGLVHKIGVFTDGAMHWVDEGLFSATIRYREHSMSSEITLTSERLGLEIFFEDVVYNEHPSFIRKVRVRSFRNEAREVKLFFNQQFFIGETARGDTAYYSVDGNAIIHYEGARVFLISGQKRGGSFDDYSVGLMGIEGKEGTWRDAEDGALSKNTIEYGVVDSVVAFTLTLEAKGEEYLWYWISCGTKYREAMILHHDILERSPAHLLETTVDFWKAWVTKNSESYCGLSKELIALYETSLFVLRTHTDEHGGIIASADSSVLQHGRDTYAYVWPRDGAFAALAFIEAGYPDLAQRYFAFIENIITEDGYLLHKYRADGALGSSWHPWVRNGAFQPPIQEDETAVIIWTLWRYYEKTRDLEFVERIYNSLIKRSAEFLLRYRDEEDELPLPSHDLWEERFSISCYTSASVAAALRAAGRFAALLGKEKSAETYERAARALSEKILVRFFMEDGAVRKLFMRERGTLQADDTQDASAWFGLMRFGILEIDDPRLITAREKAMSTLKGTRGVARYQNDWYYRTSAHATGNPWIITTLWDILYDIALAKDAAGLKGAEEKLVGTLMYRTGADLLPEQVDPESGVPLSATPLAWSHAEFILAVQAFLAKEKELGICKV